MRLSAPYLAMKQIVESGEIGEIGQIDAQKSYKLGDRPAWMLGEIRARDGVGPLLNIVRDSVETPSVRGRAAEALGSIRDPRAIGPLIECLRQSPPSVRFWSVFALGKIGDPRALPHLRALTSDDTVVPNWWSIGKEARDAIRRIRSVAGHE